MRRFVLPLIVLALGLTAASVAIGSGGSKLRLSSPASDQLTFSTKTLTAKAGRVTVVLHNLASDYDEHNIAIKGHGVNVKGKIVYGPTGISTVTATLKPGVYEFYCSVPGHEAGGMKGVLIVK